jgi:VWFA-related protein
MPVPAPVRSRFFRVDSFPRALALALLLASTVSRLAAQHDPSAETSVTIAPTAKPAAQINLAAIGYHAGSRLERLSEDKANVSLNYLDTSHVLLTFNPKKMVQRRPECPPDHDDRLVHAVVMEVPSGRVVKEADWYLHDHRRYLWSLSPGKVLLRRLNNLYVVDSSLTEKLQLSSPKPLLWVSVTPDGNQIVIETPKEPGAGSGTKNPGKLDAKYLVEFLDVKTLASKRSIPSNSVVNLEGASTGFVDLVHKNDLWLVRFGPAPGQRHNVARVKSQTMPSVVYASNNAVLIGRCPLPACDYSVSAYSVTGHRLWRQHWRQYRGFPAVARTEDASRFGISTLRVAVAASLTAKPDDVAGELDDAVEQDGFEQDIQIFETATGTPLLSVKSAPAVMSGQNFSLSPDGLHLAVLQGSGLELFDLAPASQEEQTKFSALKTDVPGLYTLASANDAAAQDTPPKATEEPDASNSASAAEEATLAASDAQENKTAGTAPSERKADDASELVPTIKVSTKAVVVDVVVTDSKGHPIKGLRQQDFQLAEDGKAQDLRSFKEFSTGDEDQPKIAPAAAKVVASVPAPAPAPAKLPPNVFSNQTRTPDAGAVTLVLMDLLNTPSADQDFARQQLIKFLQSKPKNAQFALCTMSEGANANGSHLRLIQGFTQDENQLLAAVRGKKGAPRAAHWQAGSEGTATAVTAVGDLAQAGPMSGFQGLLQVLQGMQVEQQGTDTDERAGITIDSLMQLARYLSGIPGRKNVVWLSGSFPISLVASAGSNSPSLDNRNYTGSIRRVTNLLADAQIALYPVDVRGLLGGALGADSSGSMGGPTSIDPADFSATTMTTSNGGLPQGMQALAQEAAERDTLTQFATATGGKAFYNSNGIREAIGTAYEQGSNYYTLSYSPANKAFDGKFRKIKVQLAEKGYTLHYRQGYFADDENAAAKDADLARRTRAAAMQHTSPPSRQILFSVKVAPVGGKKKVDGASVGEILLASAKKPSLPAMVEVQHYSIDYEFESSELHFMTLENAYRSVLTLMVASFDKDGRMLTGISHIGTSNLEPAIYKDVSRGEFRVHEEADVPVEAASLRLGIQDQMSNHLGTVEIPLPLPSLPDAPRHGKDPLPEIEPD